FKLDKSLTDKKLSDIKNQSTNENILSSSSISSIKNDRNISYIKRPDTLTKSPSFKKRQPAEGSPVINSKAKIKPENDQKVKSKREDRRQSETSSERIKKSKSPHTVHSNNKLRSPSRSRSRSRSRSKSSSRSRSRSKTG